MVATPSPTFNDSQTVTAGTFLPANAAGTSLLRIA